VQLDGLSSFNAQRIVSIVTKLASLTPGKKFRRVHLADGKHKGATPEEKNVKHIANAGSLPHKHRQGTN
jgi:hypothetical protein